MNTLLAISVLIAQAYNPFFNPYQPYYSPPVVVRPQIVPLEGPPAIVLPPNYQPDPHVFYPHLVDLYIRGRAIEAMKNQGATNERPASTIFFPIENLPKMQK